MLMLTLQLHIKAGSSEREAEVRCERDVGGVIKESKYTRTVIKVLKKMLVLRQRLLFSLIRGWQVYRAEILHLPRNLVIAAVQYWRKSHVAVLHFQ
jgi:hypothetical protein